MTMLALKAAARHEGRMTAAKPPRTLDLLGLKCPHPYLRTKKALKAAQAGDELIVLTSDALAVIDIPNLCRETGDQVEILAQEGPRATFRILKA
jgi:tRNA 2-thiouridine synthesizing protein A